MSHGVYRFLWCCGLGPYHLFWGRHNLTRLEGRLVIAIKKRAVKTIKGAWIYRDDQWIVRFGKLNAGPGRPQKTLFLAIGEKLPVESIGKVNACLRAKGIRRLGVYVAHDSMGYARYIP